MIATTPQTYPFSVYTFTSDEIDQIVTLVGEWSGGRVLPIDQRRYSKQVKQYAEEWGLLIRQSTRLVPDGESNFSPRYDLPPEALWRMILPIFNGQHSCGRSITYNALWESLNIWPEGHRHSTAASKQEQVAILTQLAKHNYLYVQMAGSIWTISRRTD